MAGSDKGQPSKKMKYGVNISKEESGRNAGEKSIVDCGEGLSPVGE